MIAFHCFPNDILLSPQAHCTTLRLLYAMGLVLRLLLHLILLLRVTQSEPQIHICDRNVAHRFDWFFRLKYSASKCVQLVQTAASGDSVDLCLMRQVTALNYTLYTRSLSAVNEQALDHPQQAYFKYCAHIVIISPTDAELNRLFASGGRHLFPHTTLLLLHQTNTVNLSAVALDNIHGQALHVLVASTTLRGPIRDVLTGRHIDWTANLNTPNHAAFLATHRLHPLFHAEKTLNRQRIFRVSFFNCPPYVICQPAGNASIDGPPIDGYEYRFIEAVTGQWQLQPVTRSARRPGVWDERSMELLAAGRSDLAVCAVWLSEKRAQQFDLTHEFDFSCGTFLVARPQRISASANIYGALDYWVWLALVASLALAVVSWCALSTDNGTTGVDIGRVLVDLVNVMTGHGMSTVPDCRSLRCLFMG